MAKPGALCCANTWFFSRLGFCDCQFFPWNKTKLDKIEAQRNLRTTPNGRWKVVKLTSVFFFRFLMMQKASRTLFQRWKYFIHLLETAFLSPSQKTTGPKIYNNTYLPCLNYGYSKLKKRNIKSLEEARKYLGAIRERTSSKKWHEPKFFDTQRLPIEQHLRQKSITFWANLEHYEKPFQFHEDERPLPTFPAR